MILEQITQEVSNRPLPEIEAAISLVSKFPEEEKLEERKMIRDFKSDEGEKDIFSENPVLLSSLDVPKVDYGKLFSYLENRKPQEEVYVQEQDKQEAKKEEEESAVMGNGKAGELVQKYLMAAVFGNKEDIGYQENEKFVWWLKNNPDLLSLYEKLSPIRNGNVNYGKLN